MSNTPEYLKTYWNGEPCDANRAIAVISEPAPPEITWAESGFFYTPTQIVEVNYQGTTFYLDNESGGGWAKVTRGRGSPRYGHKQYDPTEIAAIIYRYNSSDAGKARWAGSFQIAGRE